MSYNPEFWTRPYADRDKVMPAFGALASAQYKEFVDAYPEVGGGFDRFGDNDLEEIRKLSPELQPVVADVWLAHKKVGGAAFTYGLKTKVTNSAFRDKLTAEQNAWVEANTYWGADSQDMFHQQMLGGGANAFAFFTLDAAKAMTIHATEHGTDNLQDDFVRLITGRNFLAGLRQAASARQAFWTIPDNGHSVATFANRIDHLKEVSLEGVIPAASPLIGEYGMAEPVAQEMQLERKRGNKQYNPNALYEWEDLPSSGCPVRHQRLGSASVNGAFTPRQQEWISSVAQVSDTGSLLFTWDPFEATQQLMLETAGITRS